MALGSTQNLTEMSTRSISGGVKAAGAQGWKPYHHTVPLSGNLGTLTSWNPLGLSRPVMGLLYLYLYPLFSGPIHFGDHILHVSRVRINSHYLCSRGSLDASSTYIFVSCNWPRAAKTFKNLNRKLNKGEFYGLTLALLASWQNFFHSVYKPQKMFAQCLSKT